MRLAILISLTLLPITSAASPSSSRATSLLDNGSGHVYQFPIIASTDSLPADGSLFSLAVDEIAVNVFQFVVVVAPAAGTPTPITLSEGESATLYFGGYLPPDLPRPALYMELTPELLVLQDGREEIVGVDSEYDFFDDGKHFFKFHVDGPPKLSPAGFPNVYGVIPDPSGVLRAAVPEPSSIALLIMGAIGLAAMGRRARVRGPVQQQ